MSAKYRHGTVTPISEFVPSDGVPGKSATRRGSLILPMPSDTRERLTEFYRERDEADARAHASGAQKVRGGVWTIGLRRLERGDEVYESFGVLASAGIDVSDTVRKMIDELPLDWRRICQIDADGVVRAASLKGRMRSGR